jgi:2-polyprenyl-3-methyl-5-hydroxy-6-metoxy-1,4-benzoquinol methylase
MVDTDKLQGFLGKFVGDLGAALHAPLVVTGDKLGLYKGLVDGAQSPEELAKKTGTDARYVREWLLANAASGYVTYDEATGKFSLDEVQKFTLADEGSPFYLPGAFQIALATARGQEKLQAAFRTGAGVGWHEQDGCLFEGTERFFRPNYAGNLVSSWIPALDGVDARLKAGGRVADVGCGHGASTILMAESYPRSTFVGFDYHPASIETARARASAAGVADRARFEIAKAKDFPGTGYDFVTFFDCLHDMGDPTGAAAHVLKSLDRNGTWMIVEPFANDRPSENFNPVGRVFYSASTAICCPASKAQEVGVALGAQAGEARMRKVVTDAGFKRFRRATQTPFNLVFEARP